jgi:hypothetical protein
VSGQIARSGPTLARFLDALTNGVVALTGAGERTFCVGGNQKQREQSGDYEPSQTRAVEIENLHRVIRETRTQWRVVVVGVAALPTQGKHVADLAMRGETVDGRVEGQSWKWQSLAPDTAVAQLVAARIACQ